MATVWVLNLDAELELAGQTLPKTAKSFAQRIDRSHFPFLAKDDVVLAPQELGAGSHRAPESRRAAGSHRAAGSRRASGPQSGRKSPYASMRGQAWCPTPRALRLLAEAGCIVPPSPSLQVLTQVNHRRFCFELGTPLEGAQFLTDETAVVEALQEEGSWMLKRPLSMAGRGIRKVSGSCLREEDLAWIKSSLRRHHGLQVEPFVPIEAEFSLHGWIEENGDFKLATPRLQHIDAQRNWRGSEVAGASILEHESHSLIVEGERCAHALHRAGYFGPFGIDAFRYLWKGSKRFQARSEINARYTMHWSL